MAPRRSNLDPVDWKSDRIPGVCVAGCAVGCAVPCASERYPHEGGSLEDEPIQVGGLSAWNFMQLVVCLAVWTAGCMSSKTCRLIATSWCLLAFVRSGYEHSIANQSLLCMALFLSHPDTVTWGLYWLAGVPLTLRHAEPRVPAGSALSIRSVQA